MQYRFPTALAKLLRPSRTGSDPARHLTQPLVLEDGRTPRLLSTTLYTISGFILAFVAWATVSHLREVTFAAGQIVPRGQVHNVSHLEGGIVSEILVQEGERIIEGQPLMRLQPIAASSDLEQLKVRRASFMLQIMRLDALNRETPPDFGEIGREHPDLAAEQTKLYASGLDQRRQERATLATRIAQRRQDVATASAMLETAKAQVPVARDLFEIQTKLVAKGYTPTKTYLETKAALLRIEGELTTAETKLQTAIEAQAEAESSLAQADSVAVQKIAEERAKASSELAEVDRQTGKFSDRLDRVIVRAPSAGLVQEIVPKARGEVVKPGEMVARIVPSEYELVAEVRIDPKDAGFVRVGAHADLKFANYDSSLFGTLSGTVEYVSATTFQPALGLPTIPSQSPQEPYYKAVVHLASDHLGNGTRRRPIAPGMIVQASIVTGSKSITRYLLKPVFDSLDVAFTER